MRSPPLAGIEEGHANHLPILVPYYDIVIGQLRFIGMAGILEVHIKHICLLIVIRLYLLVGYVQKLRHQCCYLFDVVYICRCHTKVLLSSCFFFLVRKAVITKPSSLLTSL